MDEAWERVGEWWDAGDMESVARACTELLERDPDSASALGTRGAARAALGDLEGAIADLSRSIELEPDRSWTWAMRGDARDEAGQEVEAVVDLTRAIELDPDDAWSRLRRFQIADRRLGLTASLHEVLDAEDDALDEALVACMTATSDSSEAEVAFADLQRALELDAPMVMSALGGAALDHADDGPPETLRWIHRRREGDLDEMLGTAGALVQAGASDALAMMVALDAAIEMRIIEGNAEAPRARAALARLVIAEIDRRTTGGESGLEAVRASFEEHL